MRESMSMMRFTLLGAVGFGIGVAIGTSLVPVGTIIGGAVGGAALGLALKDFRRAVFLALLGALGLFLGVSIALILGSYLSYPMMPIAAFVGAILGGALGLAFGDWRRVLILVHIQNRCRVRRYSGNHETSDLRPFTLGHRKRAVGNRPTLQGRFRHAPSPDHPRQRERRARLDNSPLVGMRLPDGARRYPRFQ